MRTVKAREARNADLAQACRLGEELGLGTDATVARARITRASASLLLSIIMVSALVIFMFIMAIAFAVAAEPGPLVVFGVLTAGGALLLWPMIRSARAKAELRRLFRYPGGLIEMTTDRPEPLVLRWAEVDTVTLLFTDGDDSYIGLSLCTLSGRGTTMSLPLQYSKATLRGLAFEAERLLGPRIVPSLIATYQAGEPVVSGAWRIDQAAVTVTSTAGKAVTVAWPDVREITVAAESYRGQVEPASLITLTVPGSKRPQQRRLSLSDVPNGIFLVHLVEHIAKRNGVRLRKEVVKPGGGGR